MKSWKKSLSCVLLSLAACLQFTVCGSAQTVASAQNAQPDATTLSSTQTVATDSRLTDGLTFEKDRHYDTKRAFFSLPKTYEAILHVPKNQSSRAGIIIGNYMSEAYECVNFEVQYESSTGYCYPKLHFDIGQSAKATVVNFTQVDLRADGLVHVAVVHDPANNSAVCYLNGVAKQTISFSNANYGEFTYVPISTYRVGGDYRGDNAQYFKGNIASIELYSDVRSATEIKADYDRYLGTPSSDANMIAAYNFTQATGYLKDLSSNGYDLLYDGDIQMDEGLSFTADDRYVVEKGLSGIPQTFEAYVFVPKTFTSRTGIIFGNYSGDSIPSLSFEISENGKPRLFHNTPSGKTTSIVFSADVRTGDWAHVAIVHNESNATVNCYINGAHVASGTYADYADGVCDLAHCIGGDQRSGNAQYFKGWIRSVTLYSDVRSTQEIHADMTDVALDDENLIAHYDMTNAVAGQDVVDLSQNANTAEYQTTWFQEKDPLNDYAYSFAVVGDTQIITEKFPDQLSCIYDWIVASAKEKNIQFVFGLGDITNSNTAAEWEVAKAQISKLNGVVPYSLVRGNHDGSGALNRTFWYDEYTKQFGGFYEEGMIENAWVAFTAGGTDYLHITLDYGASDSVLAWAGELCESFPNHKVIVTTHAYLFRDGTTLDQGDVCPPATTGGYNNGDHMWDKFISQYGNIFLVLSGHDPCDKVVTTQAVGVHGNTVTQMLIDPQGMDVNGATGMVAMLYFSEDGTSIEVEYYSTVNGAFYLESNQYTVEHNHTAAVDAHAWVENPLPPYLETEANCTSPATYHYSCAGCEKVHGNTFTYGEPAHTYDQTVTTEIFLATEATCTSPATYYYSCECGATGEQTFAYGEPSHEHAWKEGVVTKEPTVQEEGEMSYTCEHCLQTKTQAIAKIQPSGGCGSVAVSGTALILIAGACLFAGRKRK